MQALEFGALHLEAARVPCRPALGLHAGGGEDHGERQEQSNRYEALHGDVLPWKSRPGSGATIPRANPRNAPISWVWICIRPCQRRSEVRECREPRFEGVSFNFGASPTVSGPERPDTPLPEVLGGATIGRSGSEPARERCGATTAVGLDASRISEDDQSLRGPGRRGTGSPEVMRCEGVLALSRPDRGVDAARRDAAHESCREGVGLERAGALPSTHQRIPRGVMGNEAKQNG